MIHMGHMIEQLVRPSRPPQYHPSPYLHLVLSFVSPSLMLSVIPNCTAILPCLTMASASVCSTLDHPRVEEFKPSGTHYFHSDRESMDWNLFKELVPASSLKARLFLLQKAEFLWYVLAMA